MDIHKVQHNCEVEGKRKRNTNKNLKSVGIHIIDQCHMICVEGGTFLIMKKSRCKTKETIQIKSLIVNLYLAKSKSTL